MSQVICNAGPLIALGKLNRLDLLVELYQTVQIPRSVYDEVVIQGLVRGASDALTVRLFLEHHSLPIVDVLPAALLAYAPPVLLDPGETQVLALAQTLSAPLVLLDDEVARAEARRIKLQVRGTLGIVVQAYRQRALTMAQAEIMILEIAARPDIWISAKLCTQVLAALKL
jgi:predicted nucleic acid-binding protein